MPPFCLLYSQERFRKFEQITAMAASSCQHNRRPTLFMKGICCKIASATRGYTTEHSSLHSPGHSTSQELIRWTENSSS